MTKLTKQYLEDHMGQTHTQNAFGRLLVEMSIREAEIIVGNGEKDKVNFPIEFEVSPYMPTDCIKICAKNSAGEWWCINQFEDEVYRDNR
jgi:hypothetical protein